jgi:predicted nucleic acid-binding protein
VLVVSDATPINILLRLGQEFILPRLFGEVVIPEAVAREMAHAAAPAVVRAFVQTQPAWLLVRTPSIVDAALRLGAGEREAIALARELAADLLLVDDRKARRTAATLGLRITGTLGVLLLASARGLIDLDQVLLRLEQTDFSVSPELLDEIRRQHRPRS